MNEFRSQVRAIGELEKQAVNGSSAASNELAASYEALLAQYPHLEGFWIRYAHFRFRTDRNPEAAVSVFKRALDTLNLKYSLLVWVAYLRYMVHVYYSGADKPVSDLFETASQLVGAHFLSHEFWDLYLEVHPKPVGLLLHILDDLTLHQFAKFYAKLVNALESSTDLTAFATLLPLEIQAPDLISPDELPQIKAVVLSKLKLKYELHLRRVNSVLPFELSLKNRAFYPVLPADDASEWVKYCSQSDTPVLIYRRALIPYARDPKMWLSYIRHFHAHPSDSATIEEAYSVPVKMGLVPVLLHYALYLEQIGDLDKARSIYELAEREDRAKTAEQYTQFLTRMSDGSPKLLARTQSGIQQTQSSGIPESSRISTHPPIPTVAEILSR